METVLKTCLSSVTRMFPGATQNIDPSEMSPCGKMFGSSAHPCRHFTRGSRSSSPTKNPPYIPCNFPSTPLPCSGTFSREFASEYLSEGCASAPSPSPCSSSPSPSPSSCSSSSSYPSPSRSSSSPSSSSFRSCECGESSSSPPQHPATPPSPSHQHKPPVTPPPLCDIAGYSSSELSSYSSTSNCPSIPLEPWSNPTGEEKWIRPLGYVERFMTIAGGWGNMSTVYALWLDSRGPISFEAIKHTSHLIFRKMPHLRLCIGNHKNDKWWKEMKTDNLDVEEIQSDEDVVNIFESLLTRKYDLQEGPLWFVRFLTSVNRNDLVRDSNFNLKHKYVCIFGFHHNVTDGTTNMNFCSIFVSLLNSVLQNKVIDTKEEGRFEYPFHDDIGYSISTYSFQLKTFGIRVYKGVISVCGYVNNFLKYYPMPTDQEGSTRVLQNELDEITTERLLKRCKMEGVTLNTAFTAAANIGLYRMILQRDGNVNETKFTSQQAVNMRRHWPKEKRSKSYGCHISMVDIEIPTVKEDISNFWEYARRVHKIIYQELNVDKRILKIQPLSEKLGLAIFVNSWMSRLHLPSANDSHYCITNMGDVSSTFSGDEIEVNATKILRSVSCHYMQALCQHTLQTFKGKFFYSLDYYPQKMSVGTARAYSSSLMDTLRTVIHMPN